MPQCDKCKKEFYSPNPTGITLFEGKCLDCLTPEQHQKLRAFFKETMGGFPPVPESDYNVLPVDSTPKP